MHEKEEREGNMLPQGGGSGGGWIGPSVAAQLRKCDGSWSLPLLTSFPFKVLPPLD